MEQPPQAVARPVASRRVAVIPVTVRRHAGAGRRPRPVRAVHVRLGVRLDRPRLHGRGEFCLAGHAAVSGDDRIRRIHRR